MHPFLLPILSSLPEKEFRELINAGFQITEQAGLLAQKKHFSPLTIRHKGCIDLVTDVDVATEDHIISFLQKEFPTHGILSEEIGKIEGESPYTWIIDPIDGTTNYAHHLPFWAVSIALYKQDKPIAGWVFSPEMHQFFYAVQGVGSWLNQTSLHVSSCSCLGNALLATGFPYTIRETEVTNIDLFFYFSKRTLAVRRFGSAALDTCYVGAGMLDGYWEQYLKPWDFAAASIVLHEAKGIGTTIQGRPLLCQESSFLCANPILYAILLHEIQQSGACLSSI